MENIGVKTTVYRYSYLMLMEPLRSFSSMKLLTVLLARAFVGAWGLTSMIHWFCIEHETKRMNFLIGF